jgi:predicted site-specific integrase-resolvase
MTGKIAYTISEAVEATGLSRDTLYRRHREGAITMRKVVGRTVIPVADLERLIQEAPAVSRSAA